MDTREFVEKARIVHRDRYDYGRAVFVHSKQRIAVRCPEHGEFNPTPNDHLSKRSGCPACGRIAQIEKRRKPAGQFDAELENTQPGKYVRLGPYVNNKAKTRFKCNTCEDDFTTAPEFLLGGHGCPPCAKERSAGLRRLNVNELSEKLQAAYPGRYELIGAYRNMDAKIDIRYLACGCCASISPRSLVRGSGCVSCEGLSPKDMRVCLRCSLQFKPTSASQKFCANCFAEANDERTRKFHEDNPGYRCEYIRERRANDPAYKLLLTIRCLVVSTIKKGGGAKRDRTMELTGCSIEFARAHLERQFTTGMTWDNHGAWHIDHRTPCAAFDMTDPEQQKKAFHYTNLQPLWAADNRAKSDLLPDGTRGRHNRPGV